jgi:hypothetical protein
MGAKVDLLEIGAADAASCNFHQKLARAYAGHGHCFDPHVVHSVVNHGPHGGGELVFQLARRI